MFVLECLRKRRYSGETPGFGDLPPTSFPSDFPLKSTDLGDISDIFVCANTIFCNVERNMI